MWAAKMKCPACSFLLLPERFCPRSPNLAVVLSNPTGEHKEALDPPELIVMQSLSEHDDNDKTSDDPLTNIIIRPDCGGFCLTVPTAYYKGGTVIVRPSGNVSQETAGYLESVRERKKKGNCQQYLQEDDKKPWAGSVNHIRLESAATTPIGISTSFTAPLTPTHLTTSAMQLPNLPVACSTAFSPTTPPLTNVCAKRSRRDSLEDLFPDEDPVEVTPKKQKTTVSDHVKKSPKEHLDKKKNMQQEKQPSGYTKEEIAEMMAENPMFLEDDVFHPDWSLTKLLDAWQMKSKPIRPKPEPWNFIDELIDRVGVDIEEKTPYRY